MDSGNSGSLQSSSGGDEEYDSRAAADSVSAFLSGGGGGPVSNPPPFFDPLSNYLQLHQNPNLSFLNPNNAWPRNSSTTAPRSDPNPNPITHHLDTSNPMLPNSPPFMPTFRPPAAGGGADLVPPPLQPGQNQNQPAAARNPKKRSRASRRAPTTVLTTDTNNFRAMVQEFTGIPAPPFNSSSSFPRSRLDLFGNRSSTSFDAPPPYLRRPFPQKLQPPLPFLPSSSSLQISSAAIDGVVAASSPTNNNNNHIITSVNSSTTIEASSSSSPNLFNNNNIIPNPLLTSFLQSNPKFPFSNHHLLNTKIGGFDEQFRHGDHHNHVSATDHSINNNAAIWNNNPTSPDGDRDDRINLNGAGPSYNFPAGNTVNNDGKMSFGGGKAPESNAAAAASRGEGMVESWICSSD